MSTMEPWKYSSVAGTSPRLDSQGLFAVISIPVDFLSDQYSTGVEKGSSSSSGFSRIFVSRRMVPA